MTLMLRNADFELKYFEGAFFVDHQNGLTLFSGSMLTCN